MHVMTDYPQIPKNFEERVKQAQLLSWKYFGKKIRFYAPGFVHYENRYFRSLRNGFPSISITGSSCSLNCSHCEGKLLRTMIPATSPQTLVETCKKIKAKGAVGCLISGGCLPDGSVPIGGLVDAIAEAKKLGLTIVVHSGLINVDMANRLKKDGVDAVSIDILGSKETAKEIYHVGAKVEDYRQSLRALKSSEIHFTPHVLVGLHYGELRDELSALRMIAEFQPSALILIVFFPIRGTRMENVKPPSPETVADVLIKARSIMPKVPIALGCARPKGKLRSEIDVLAVKAGVNAIAFPTLEAVKAAMNLGVDMTFSNLCCSLVYADITLASEK
jgi:uncharacterized radical SAM superfamily protein